MKNSSNISAKSNTTLPIPDSELPEFVNYADKQKGLMDQILKTTLIIKDKFPELSKYLEEMPETIPDEKNPEITLNNLRTYNDSLEMLMEKYLLEHPEYKI